MRRLYSFYADAFRIALKSIFEHKLRAFLTLLGVIIGVASVVVVGASISGLNSYVMEKITAVLGANHFMIARMAFTGHMEDDEFERLNKQNKKIEWAEFEYIKAKCSMCSEVGAAKGTREDLKQDGIEMPGVRINGVTANMVIIEDKKIADGRFILPTEVERSARVAVIGADVQEKYFANTNPVGKTIKVRGVPMRIVGVEEKRGSMFGDSQDRHIYIPVSTHLSMFGWGDGVQIHGKSADPENLKLAIEDARQELRNRRKLIGSDEDTFGVVNTEDLGAQIDQFTGAIAGVVIPITFITLVVGGIVVMNIMLVSVTERTFEVGLRKAIGATRKQIMLQFLIESSVLCLLGGLLGIALAAGVTQLVGYALEITMTITIGYIVLAVAVSSLIGIIAGFYPAYKASKLDPIVALTRA
ncbi:MAG TPA: ABC transporter permease [Aridibacter sp.]|nr:ABC transporter permease [Aridibacter sp.]